eukprot:Plantae.Rhodophyta-Hildenbrandia_rubra.ctg2743.p1 GENE.Plantae.Rhodophyta-Hildenbrandia_rubra.ctg2743~~Plantae.Rhodophyta-Hildenbrandia_rubra.ctg2743.p1  ORF type:complete len:1201 (-),score=257.99 Plantae.Rhodophyta-Hildenbrandia_rubra.ctg2743:2601-6203(-)
MCTTETVPAGVGGGGKQGKDAEGVDGLIKGIVGGRGDVGKDGDGRGAKRVVPEEGFGHGKSEMKRARSSADDMEEGSGESNGDMEVDMDKGSGFDVEGVHGMAVDPLSTEFPDLDAPHGVGGGGDGHGDDVVALGSDVTAGGQIGATTSNEDIPDPFSLDHGNDFAFPDLDVVEASTSGLTQDNNSLEIVTSTVTPESAGMQSETSGVQVGLDGQGNGGGPDFSSALKEMEEDVYEDDVLEISSDDEETNPTMQRTQLNLGPNVAYQNGIAYPNGAAYPSRAIFPHGGAYPNPGAYPGTYPNAGGSYTDPTTSTIDLTGEGPVQITPMQRSVYGQTMQPGYMPVPGHPYSVHYAPYTRQVVNPDQPLDKDSLEDLMKKNNLTADATEEDPTPEQMECVLMPHQKRALKWMRKRECMDASVRGGILADDQGLGKTLSTIALMVINQPRPIQLDEEGFAPDDYESHCYDIPAEAAKDSDDDDEDAKMDCWGKQDHDSSVRDCKKTMKAPWRTLIVCPVSLVHQWKEELQKHLRAQDQPHIYIYHGKTKTQDIEELQAYDVVITTYSTLAMQYPKVNKKDPRYDACKEAKAELPTRAAGAMYKMTWFRVILDEAQYIKNRYTENFQAVHQLKAYRRWCLTGTPIQNSVDDLYSQFVFIRYKIVPNYKEWQRVWKKKLESPYAMTRERAFKRFQAVVGVVLLRRTKLDRIDNKPLIALPDRTVELKELDFKDPDEASFYQSVQVTSILAVNKYLTNGTISNNYSSILLLLLRLRQAATHPHLMMSLQRSYDLSGALLDPSKQMTLEQLKYTFGPAVVHVFTCGVPPVCSGCQSNAESFNSVVVGCGHVFCCECIPDPMITCPECQVGVGYAKWTLEEAYNNMKLRLGPLKNQTVRQKVATLQANQVNQAQGAQEQNNVQKMEHEVAKPEPSGHPAHGQDAELKAENAVPVKMEIQNAKQEERLEINNAMTPTPELEKRKNRFMSSTKLDTLVQELNTVRQGNAEAKSLVFSQWTSMLDIIENTLHHNGFKTCRLDGSMAMSARRDQIERFKTCNKHTVMLISLHAGGTGLNLTVAQNVFLMDVWWNPAVEEQAIDRAHRIGQKSNVRVVRMKIRGTVEERIYDLCAKKREMMNGALGAKGSQSLGRKKLSMKELLYLFGGAAEDVLNTNNGRFQTSASSTADGGQSNAAAQAAANILAFARNGK